MYIYTQRKEDAILKIRYEISYFYITVVNYVVSHTYIL